MYEIYQFWGHDLSVLSEDSSHEANIQDGKDLDADDDAKCKEYS